MIVAAHQPHYLPWLGYLAKVAAADLFVVMDDLQYEDQNFQNRNRVKFNHGAIWLTVPLERGAQSDRISDKRIANGGSPRAALAAAPLRDAAHPLSGRAVLEALRAGAARRLRADAGRSWPSSICTCCSCICAGSTSTRRSCWRRRWAWPGTRPIGCRRSVRAVGADTYLSGGGGSRGYLDVAQLRAAGVRVQWQTFAHPRHPQRYPQLGFTSHLGALDLLLNCGPASRRLLDEAALDIRRPAASEAAAAPVNYPLALVGGEVSS